MQGRAIVVGGSIAGLAVARMLALRGWEVEVFERVAVDLSGRGAGIVTHRPLIDALECCGADTGDLGITSRKRTAWDRDGRRIHEFDFPQLVTSWDCLHGRLRALVPDGRHHLGHVLDTFEDDGTGVTARFANGHQARGDLLVGADGFRSTIRAQLFPEIRPAYAGYVVWRGLVDESDLPSWVRDEVFEHFGFFLPDGDGEVIGYPIAGAGNDTRPGHRRYNFVWYRVVEAAALDDMLTDATGHRHELSIPPPLIRRAVTDRLKAEARDRLAPPFLEILIRAKALFFTPIYDLASPSMAAGRVALAGDAAVLARPHIGAGVTKAVEDARVLAETLAAADSVPAGLAAYSAARSGPNRRAYERGQHMGEYLVPRPDSDTGRAGGPVQHDLQSIMRDTAVLDAW